MIRTVLGDVDVPAGPFLAHEHLQIDLAHNKGADNVLGHEEEDAIIDDLGRTVQQYGLRAVVDLSVPGSGRNPEALRRISQRAGVSVICATGFYWDPLPNFVIENSREIIRDIMIREIETGINGSEIRCGTIKIGTDNAEPSGTVEKLFRAAVSAAKATGMSVITHTSKPEQANWHLDVMQDAGMNLSNVVISHLHKFENFSDILSIAKRGAFIGIDQLGFKKGPSLDQIADIVAQAVAHGFGKQLILSSDIARKSRLISNGGTGYATTFSAFLPLLKDRNISEAQVNELLSGNPRRLFTIRTQ